MPVTGFTKQGFGQKPWVYADQGASYVATNPTPGTGIASAAVTTLADTTPLLIVKNNNPVGSGIRIYLDSLFLSVSAAGGGGTVRNMTFLTDASQTTARYSSGGTAITPVNTNSDVANASSAVIQFGALTAVAAGSKRLIANYVQREIIEIANDTFFYDFGAVNSTASSNLATGGAATVARYFAVPPIVIGPQEHALAHYWGTSLTAATFEFVLRYLEL